MGDTRTKAIAARLPLEEYWKLVNRAEGLNIAISDYLIMKLNLSELEEATDEVIELSKRLDLTQKELQKERNKLTKTTKKYESKLEEYEAKIRELESRN